MKRFLLAIVMGLVLTTGIVFCGCKNNYDDLEIKCNVGEIRLVLDDDELKFKKLIFELSGAKSWGEVSIVSKPDGVVRVVEYEMAGKECGVKIEALQPTGAGASLVFTHLGSGEACTIPLNVGRRLQSVESNNNDYIIQLPVFEKGQTSKQVEILSSQLLNFTPLNYTDDIVWQRASGTTLPAGVNLVSYNNEGDVVDKVFIMDDGAVGTKLSGISPASKTMISITNTVRETTEFQISPVSVLDNGKAFFYSDVVVNVKIVDLLNSDNVVITSSTHSERIDIDKGDKEGSNILKELVLLSNPDENIQRNDINLGGYSNYSTALIELKKLKDNTQVEFDIALSELYNMQLSSNINDLLLENLGFGRIRAIASTTCYGQGNINIKFVPKDSVGDVKEFSVVIPCIVGERPTSFNVTNNGVAVEIDAVDEYGFVSTNVPLNDSDSYGQSFKFEVLSTNTLSALKQYRIRVERSLLHINQKYVYEKDGQTISQFIRNSDDSGYFNLGVLKPREYQIALLKDGREINFYDNGSSFVSEPLTNKNTIYIRWEKNAGGEPVLDTNFGITVTSYYNNDYDVKNDGFNKLALTYSITFNRQRTVARVEYTPIKVTEGGNLISAPNMDNPDEAYTEDWQFYLTPEMIRSNSELYGIKITQVRGLNDSVLADNELANINLDISVEGKSFVNRYLGLTLYAKSDTGIPSASSYTQSCVFNYEKPDVEKPKLNIILLGLFGDGDLFGEYCITIKQTNKQIGETRDILVYKTLNNDDITISVPNADYDANKFLRYEKLNSKPSDFASNYSSYYEYIGGEYVSLTRGVWNAAKTYYKKVYTYAKLTNKPADFESDYSNYYQYDEIGCEFKSLDDNSWDDTKTYYQKIEVIDTLLDLDRAYILSSSQEYVVDINIKDQAFVNIGSKPTATAKFVNSYRLLEMQPEDWTIGNYYRYNSAEKAYSKVEDGATFIPNVYFERLETGSDSLLNIVKDDNKIKTMDGTFNILTGVKNYIEITYTIIPTAYDYYRQSAKEGKPETKTIYAYVYEPLDTASFDWTMIYKYDYEYMDEYGVIGELLDEYGKQTINVVLNGRSNADVLNYVDILWKTQDDKIISFEQKSKSSATYTFGGLVSDDSVTSSIYAVITQFGKQYSVFCGYKVSKPIFTERLVLNTPTNNFKSGGTYINLKVGDSLDIDAEQYSQYGNISMPGISYATCTTTGYFNNSIIDITQGGMLTAQKAGRARLVIVSNDALHTPLNVNLNYINTLSYVRSSAKKCVLIVDVIVSDGSEENPYLIASANDFKAINDDYDASLGMIDKHYALVNDIDLKGFAISIKPFAGSIFSYQENEYSDNKFNIYGIILTESNPSLFSQLTSSAKIVNIIFNVDVYYHESQNHQDKVLIGVVGNNEGKISNTEVVISGEIFDNNLSNNYIVGLLVAHNQGQITLDQPKTVGVQGDIIAVMPKSTIVLGGLIGVNEGVLTGSHVGGYVDDGNVDVKYEVYYDNQGATTDVKLQVRRVGNKDNSAVGGVIGINNGTQTTGIVNNVYSTGEIYGLNEAGNAVVNNIGGIIGKNTNTAIITPTIKEPSMAIYPAIESITYNANDTFQINNCYSDAKVYGADNVGGVVGFDKDGSYFKVYYETYSNAEISIQGNNNVGGLIGQAVDSNLYYCYAQNFAWNYIDTTQYNIKAESQAGGLIGYAKSSKEFGFDSEGGMNVVNSLASINIDAGSGVASGLIGKLENHGAIYVAYYYGVIKDFDPSAQGYLANTSIGMAIPYNNVYAIINNQSWAYINSGEITQVPTTEGNGFKINPEYNNGKPHIEYNGTNLVTIMPAIIQIDKAFEVYYKQDANGDYVYSNGEWVKYNAGQHDGYTRYLKSGIYRQNVYGEYVKINGNIYIYNQNDASHQGKVRYSVMAELINAEKTDNNKTDYRNQALLMYYYQFKDMTGNYATSDMNTLNTIDMHTIIEDDGIILIPETIKRFSLRSSNSDVVKVVTGGKLLLRGEGQATITIISSLNPAVTASFVVVVRNKILDFNLYLNADKTKTYMINNDTVISIVKGSSKIIESDYSSIVQAYYNREYALTPTIHTEIHFIISHPILDVSDIRNYITLNGKYDESKNIYTISNNESITISVNEYIDGMFTITAKPYIIATYQDDNGNIVTTRVEFTKLFDRQFSVATKQGASAINTNKTQIDMMPADEPSNIDVKISTDIKLEELCVEIIDQSNVSGTDVEYAYVEMLDIIHKGDLVDMQYNASKSRATARLDISDAELDNMLQSLNLTLRLNNKSHYVKQAFVLQVKLYVLSGTKPETIINIKVMPQAITSIVPLNYRIKDSDKTLSFNNSYISSVIRPGSTNIITVDLVPNIAVYDYIEIKDTTVQDKIMFVQVDSNLNSLEEMDEWIDNGIKIKKFNNDSKIYLLAKLPENSTRNITHTIQIDVHIGQQIVTQHFNLEAIMYPTVIMTYTDPKGNKMAEANTTLGKSQQHEASANLAVGVEASIDVTAYNIDSDSLKHQITITNNAGTEISNNNYVNLEYIYGKYVLRFNIYKQAEWNNLIGGKVSVTFTASKHLNGVTETCKATINFVIRKFVVHGISMTHSTIQNNEERLYGVWDETFVTEFYFDKTDISYYNNGYWNIQYDSDDVLEQEGITNLLKNINKLYSQAGASVVLKLNESDITSDVKSDDGYSKSGIKIIHDEDTNKFNITAKETSNINNLKLSVEFKLRYDNNVPIISNENEKEHFVSEEFGFAITKKASPFDEYLDIETPDDFINMIEGKYYKLIKDIELDNYIPLNTAIGGFTGNGKTITIKTFNTDQLIQDYISGGMYVGLFGTLAKHSVLQNIQVRYDNVKINLTDNYYIKENYSNSIFFGGIAAVNLGVITNAYVNGSFTITNNIVPSEQIDLGGIAAVNGSVGDTEVATITNTTSDITLQAIGLLGGVAGTNNGKITNTIFGGKISNADENSVTNNTFASSAFSAGFVVENSTSGHISLSYVKHQGSSTEDINSVGNTAGFVYNNVGTVVNSYLLYTNIASHGNIAGFVYQNPGYLSKCYAYPTIPNSTFYQEFIYITSNIGNISDCYVVTDSDRTITISGLKAIKKANSEDAEQYKGFVFGSVDGVWSIDSGLPQICSAGFVPQTDLYKYENVYNIYDVETYQGYFDMNRIQTMNGKTFKIVRDINFENSEIGNPITYSLELTTNLEGNDMELSNYVIYNEEERISNIGLFASIRNCWIRNLNIKPSSIKASASSSVGALAGLINNAKAYNITIDNENLIILGGNAVGGLAGTIKGTFEIAGIKSNVSVFATYKYKLANQYNLYTGKNITGTSEDNLKHVSYAGSIAGVVNGYSEDRTFQGKMRDGNKYSSIYQLEVTGRLTLIGETVGALFGLVGECTLVDTATYYLDANTIYQAKYTAGGLVGENRGKIQNAHIKHAEIVDDSEETDYTQCFNKSSKVNGGIVGLNIGGYVLNCSSSITINNQDSASTVGGIVGRNIEGSVHNCTTDGNLEGFYVGGIIGADYCYETMIEVNNGHGSATSETKIVYRAVAQGVYYGEEQTYQKFVDNIIGTQFINNLLKQMSSYYSFNSNYITNNEVGLVIASKAFGLVIGITDKEYVIDIDGLKFDLMASTTQTNNYTDYKLTLNNTEFEVKALYNYVDVNIQLENENAFVYVIAKEGIAYESWSSTTGYGPNVIIFSKKGLETATK